MKVIVIIETDMEYGYPLFVDVASSPERALEIMQERERRESDPLHFLVLSEKKDQILESYKGKPYGTLYFLEEVEVK